MPTDYLEAQRENARAILHLAAERIRKGQEKYCCYAVDHAASDLNLRSMNCHVQAQNALWTFCPQNDEVSSFMRLGGDFEKGSAHGWFGYPSDQENQSTRVFALLLAAETV